MEQQSIRTLYQVAKDFKGRDCTEAGKAIRYGGSTDTSGLVGRTNVYGTIRPVSMHDRLRATFGRHIARRYLVGGLGGLE